MKRRTQLPLCFLAIVTGLLWVTGVSACGASSFNFILVPRFQGVPLPLEKCVFTNTHGQSFSVTRLDLLLSEFSVRDDQGIWGTQTNWNAYISLGGQRTTALIQNIPIATYDRIRFNVGVRPEINHSNPAQYPADHPLNPNLNGLHWGWANGYVFFAIEGHWQSRDGRSRGYSFHLGNDPMLTTVELAVPSERRASMDVVFNVDRLFDFRFSDETSSTHSREGDELARRLRDNLKQAFAIEPREPGKAESTVAHANVSKATVMESNRIGTRPYRFTFSSDFPRPDLPRDNPLTEEGVELGHRLFGEKLLSVNRTQSCASCHRAEAAFSDPHRPLSRGAEGLMGKRNSMPLFNLAWKKSFFWDGRSPSLRQQVLAPIQDPIEMHETLDRAVAKLAATERYPRLFERAFGSHEITAERIARALEQFLLVQLSYNSRFDRALTGKEELTELEKRGFELFMTEYDPRREQFGADCFHCHGGPFFTTHGFANNGLDIEFKDFGRFAATTNKADHGKFSIPSLRNVEVTGPYMHDGRFQTLEEVVEHYASGVKRTATLDPNLAKHPDGGVPLSDGDKKALVAFLKTLTDVKFKPAGRFSALVFE